MPRAWPWCRGHEGRCGEEGSRSGGGGEEGVPGVVRNVCFQGTLLPGLGRQKLEKQMAPARLRGYLGAKGI